MISKDLKEAIKLLEQCHPRLANGCSFEGGKLSLISDDHMKNNVAEFLNKFKDNKIEIIKIPYSRIY